MNRVAPQIVTDPTVRFGKPVIAGTRVTVAAILAKRTAGMTDAEIMQEYDLSEADLQAVLAYKKLENQSQKSNHAQTN